MLPRHRCSILAEKTDWRIRSTGLQDSFSVVAASPDTLPSQNAQRRPLMLFALRQLYDVSSGILESDELATAGQGNWIVERSFPTANGLIPRCIEPRILLIGQRSWRVVAG
jgi:hypothetical protein